MKYLSKKEFIQAVHLESYKGSKSVFFDPRTKCRLLDNTANRDFMNIIVSNDYQPVIDLGEVYDKAGAWDDACQIILKRMISEVEHFNMQKIIKERSDKKSKKELYHTLKNGRIFARCCNIHTLKSSLFGEHIPYKQAIDDVEDIVLSLALLGAGSTIHERIHVMQPVTEDDLNKWGVSFSAALDFALSNNKAVLRPEIRLVTDTTSKITNNRLLNLYSIGNLVDAFVSSAVFYKDFLSDFARSHNLREAYLIIFEDHVIFFSAKGIDEKKACDLAKKYIEANIKKGGADAIYHRPLFFSAKTNKITPISQN